MSTLDCRQGDATWHAARAKHFCASEAAAAMGLSIYVTRGELLRQKSTGIIPEVDPAKQRLFDAGHAAEDAARPIVEAIIGEELFPQVVTKEIDGLPLLASMDGLTMGDDLAWENKLANVKLLASLAQGEIPDTYWPQLEQGLLVSGAERVYFTASDGTEDGTIGVWYQSQPERRAALIAAWQQFKSDLAAYVPQEVIPAAVAAPIKDLPALTVEISGRVTASNLSEWQAIVTERIESINTDLQTDQHFADAADMVKFLDDGEKRIDLVKSQAQAQATDIDAVFRALDDIKATMRAKRLTLDKLVTARKDSIKIEIVMAGTEKLAEHIAALNTRLGKNYMPPIDAAWGYAVKGKRTVASLRDAVDTLLSQKKIEASEIADRIEINLKVMTQLCDPAIIFPDFAQVCTKATEDFAALVAMRVGQHKAAEEKKEADLRARISAEEQAKLEARIAAETAERQRKEAEEKAQADRLAGEEASRAMAANPPIQPATVAPQTAQLAMPPRGVEQRIEQAQIDNGARMKLGEICAALGFTVTADFLAKLGFNPVARDKNAMLYRALDFPTLCDRIIDHVAAARNQRRAA